MSEIPHPLAFLDSIETHYVYLIACHGHSATYVKVGMTRNLKRRISEIQTGCPFQIANAFAISSEYWEETKGLEKLLHMLLRQQRLRGEWYEGTEAFFSILDAVLRRINSGGFSYEELLEMPNTVGSEFEIMLHRHEFCFCELILPLTKGTNPIESAEATPPERIAAILSGGFTQQSRHPLTEITGVTRRSRL